MLKDKIKSIKNKASRSKEKSEKTSRSFFSIKNILILIVVLYFILAVVFGFVIYKYKNESSLARFASKIIPYPAGYAGGRFVLMNTYFKNLEVQENYLTNFKKIDLKSDAGKKELASARKTVMKKIMEDALISKEAKKQNVKLSNSEINNAFNELLKSNSGPQDFAEILNKFYGQSQNEFKKMEFIPKLIREKLTEKINKEESVTEASKKKAEEVLAKIKAGGDFAKLAKEYSEDSTTAANGGDKGFIKKNQELPEFEKAAFELKTGEVSGLVRTIFGYHIIKVTDKKTDQVRASHVLIKVRDFTEWLSDTVKVQKTQKFLGLWPKYHEIYLKSL